ncbi:hypothetical protein C6501_18015 [Candidatus Poribacteria bacterium]|nr:MAG: hypothetical protein C6501_18015 [Candidatus Poribacteria bacterium]
MPVVLPVTAPAEESVSPVVGAADGVMTPDASKHVRQAPKPGGTGGRTVSMVAFRVFSVVVRGVMGVLLIRLADVL